MASSSQQILGMLNAECVAVRSRSFGEQVTVTTGHPMLTIEGRDYSPDDPTAVERMTEKGRQLFWKNCSDKGRDSERYHAFASMMLTFETGLLEEDMEDAGKYAIIRNRVHRFCELVGGLEKAGCRDWKEALLSSSNENLRLMLDAPRQAARLVGALCVQSTPDPLKLLVSLDAETLKSILENANTHLDEAARGVRLSDRWCLQQAAEPSEEQSPAAAGPACR